MLVPISGIQRAVVEALEYARTLSRDVAAVYVNIDPLETERVRTQWERWGEGVPLVVLDSPYRSLMEPLLEYIEQVYRERPDDYVTVVLPEFVPARWWHHLFHNQRALLIKGALLFKPQHGRDERAVPSAPIVTTIDAERAEALDAAPRSGGARPPIADERRLRLLGVRPRWRAERSACPGRPPASSALLSGHAGSSLELCGLCGLRVLRASCSDPAALVVGFGFPPDWIR